MPRTATLRRGHIITRPAELCLHFGLAASATRRFEHPEAVGLEEVPGVGSAVAIVDGIARAGDSAGFGFEVDWASSTGIAGAAQPGLAGLLQSNHSDGNNSSSTIWHARLPRKR
jgi:hypothetical protein